jgi:LysR family transcriptional regulator, low CO2-responsive transcriptional regulator
LRSYDLDIAVTGRPPSDLGVEMKFLGRHPHIIIASPDHRLARRKPVAPSDLADETFITRERGSGTRMLMEQFFQKSSRAKDQHGNGQQRDHQAGGDGRARHRLHIAAHGFSRTRREAIVTLKAKGLPVMRQRHAIRRVDKLLLPPAQAMLDFLGKEGSHYLPKQSGN